MALADLVFEIKVNRSWVKVRYDIFRSWTGERRVDGAPYHGPVVEFLSGTAPGGVGPKEVDELIEWEFET